MNELQLLSYYTGNCPPRQGMLLKTAMTLSSDASSTITNNNGSAMNSFYLLGRSHGTAGPKLGTSNPRGATAWGHTTTMHPRPHSHHHVMAPVPVSTVILDQLDTIQVPTTTMVTPMVDTSCSSIDKTTCCDVITDTTKSCDTIISTLNNLSTSSAQSTTTVATTANFYGLSEYDIIVGRHKEAFRHIGNRRFRAVISSYLPQYFEKSSRTQRTKLTLDIMHSIEGAGGRFLKQQDGHVTTSTSGGVGGGTKWVDLNEKEKRNKVGHALRDAAGCITKMDKINTLKNGAKHNKVKPSKAKPVLASSNQKKMNNNNNNNKTYHDDEISSLLNDDSIDVDFPIDFNLLMSMPE